MFQALEHADHANETDEVKNELPARQPFAVKLGFKRDRHKLVHRSHDNRANPTEHEQVCRRNDVLVVM